MKAFNSEFDSLITRITINELDDIGDALRHTLELQNVNDLPTKAVKLSELSKKFSNILRQNKNVKFRFASDFRHDYTYQKKHIVQILEPFNCDIINVKFNSIENLCKFVYTKNGLQIAYPDTLKLGNVAIGQAWLADNTPVFTSRDAIIHSLNSSCKRLYYWVNCFKEDIERMQ